MGIAPLMMVVVLAVVVVAGLLVAKSPRLRRALVVMAAVGLVLVVVGAALMLTRVSFPAGQSVPNVVIEIDTHTRPSTPTAWMPGVEEQFHADLYPSMESAARALGNRLAMAFEEQPSSAAADALLLPAHELPSEDLVLSTIANVLASKLKPGIVFIGPRAHEGATNPIDITIDAKLTEPSGRTAGAPWNAAGNVPSGRLRAHLDFGNGPLDVHVQFVDKPWIDDYGFFVSRNPDRRWMLARSSQFAAGPAEAEQAALDNAISQVLGRIGRSLHRAPIATHELVAIMQQSGCVVDQFAQRLRRPYGDLWRHALLIDASPQVLTQLTRRVTRSQHARRASWLGSTASMVVLVFVMCGLYFFVNMATKGYYEWPLRIVLGLLVAVTVAVVLM